MASAVVIEPMIAENFNSEAATAGTALVAAVGGYTAWADATSGIALNAPGGLVLPQIDVSTPIAIRITTADPAESDFGWAVRRAAVFNGVGDTQMNIGYNIDGSGLRLDTDKTAAYWTIEGTYQYSPTLSRTETYLEIIQTAAAGGGSMRPLEIYIEHQSDYVLTMLKASQILFLGYDDTYTSQMTFKPHQAVGELSLVNTQISLDTNDISAISQMNAGETGAFLLIKANAADQVQLGEADRTVNVPGTAKMDKLATFGAAGFGSLADVLAISCTLNYPTTYLHKIKASNYYGGSGYAKDNQIAFNLCDGSENGSAEALRLRGDKRAVLGAPASAIEDAGLNAGQISFYLDESGNTLTVKAKYANGSTIKTGTVALT